jgi:uncharacterized membrane protein
VYWAGAEIYLIAPESGLSIWQGVAISAASLGLGWLIYDRLCKSGLAGRPTLLMLVLFALLVAMGWGYTQVFTGRAMMLHLGAFTATIMTANVFFIIMPNQRIVVADLKAGRVPEARYGRIAKLRSTHNNYLTLPVIFLMLSNHYPLAFATEYNWIIAALVFLMGVTIRHFFNTMHAGGGYRWWTWGVTGLLFAAIIPGRCSMCHARAPYFEGIRHAPKNVLLETEADIAHAARAIYLQAGVTHAMPPANLSYMEEGERRAVRRWYRAAMDGGG